MNSARIDHDLSERRSPRYFYHTPFSYIAFWLVLLMIVPMSGRISSVAIGDTEARTHGKCQRSPSFVV